MGAIQQENQYTIVQCLLHVDSASNDLETIAMNNQKDTTRTVPSASTIKQVTTTHFYTKMVFV